MTGTLYNTITAEAGKIQRSSRFNFEIGLLTERGISAGITHKEKVILQKKV